MAERKWRNRQIQARSNLTRLGECKTLKTASREKNKDGRGYFEPDRDGASGDFPHAIESDTGP